MKTYEKSHHGSSYMNDTSTLHLRVGEGCENWNPMDTVGQPLTSLATLSPLGMSPSMSFSQAAIHEGCDQDNTDRWRPAFSVANLNILNNMNLCEACQILDSILALWYLWCI